MPKMQMAAVKRMIAIMPNDDETMPSAMTDEQTAEAANDEQPVMATADNATSDDATIADAAETQPISPDDELSDNADDKT